MLNIYNLWYQSETVQCKTMFFPKTGKTGCFLIEICPLPWLLSTFHISFSSEPQGQYQPNFTQSILGGRRFNFIQIKGHALFQGRGVNIKILKTHWRKLKTYARTGPISTKIGTKHRWLFTNKGPFNSQIE
mgnify:CR=1 FL=1